MRREGIAGDVMAILNTTRLLLRTAFAGLLAMTCILLSAWGRDAMGAEKSAPAPLHSVAVLPLQNEGDPRYTLSEDHPDVLRLFDFIKERQGKMSPEREVGRADKMQAALTLHLCEALVKRGYSVFAGRDFADFYRAVEARRQSVTYAELQKLIPAKIFLLVRFDCWDASDFDSEGRLRIAFRAYAIDPQQPTNKGIIWTAGATKSIELEKSDFLFRKRQDEMLKEVARVVLKTFPEPISAS